MCDCIRSSTSFILKTPDFGETKTKNLYKDIFVSVD